jgi:uncharacterized membrane protein YgcG
MRRLSAALLALVALPAFAKSLYWRSLDVAANLDRDGRLHVVETQKMVFDGDWNGGERTFRIGTGQSISFQSLARVEGGVEHPLTSGDLAKVDNYGFTSPTVLRWRSRLPDDPPFANQEITYVLRYSLAGVLRETDGVYELDHDFAFTDRAGDIQRFSLRFDVDPVWRGAKSPITMERTNLHPGQGAVVGLRLDYAGNTEALSVLHTPSRKASRAVAVIFIVILALLLFDFALAEKEKGRFARLTPTSEIDGGWLETHVFALTPEAAGALMTGKTGAAQVAAMLARMTQEGKIKTHVEERRSVMTIRQVLCLELLADKNGLPSSEKKLVDRLFVKGSDTTDTDAIRKYYKNRGFDPAAIVEQGTQGELQRFKAPPGRFDWRFPAMIVGASLLLFIGALGGDNNVGVVFFAMFVGFLVLIAGAIAASLNSKALSWMPLRFALVALFLAPIVVLSYLYTLSGPRLMLHLITPIALCAWAATIVKLTLNMLRSPESKKTIEARKRIYSARRYFIEELRSPSPRLRDDWYPYFLSLGLGRNVDQWFGSFGAAQIGSATRDTTSSISSTSSSMSSSSSTSFTGGGGAFGGAGASGGWALAATAIGAGVASPSSSGGSSGGSSSSSSSSSSGGGGGGGW